MQIEATGFKAFPAVQELTVEVGEGAWTRQRLANRAAHPKRWRMGHPRPESFNYILSI
jgi:hypothetical protein